MDGARNEDPAPRPSRAACRRLRRGADRIGRRMWHSGEASPAVD